MTSVDIAVVEPEQSGTPPEKWLLVALSIALRYGMVAVFVVMVIVTSILDSGFLTSENLLNLLLQWAPQGLMAIGMTYVIISGGFDLSVGGTYAGATVLGAAIANHAPLALAIAATMAAGAAVGVLNGGLITRLDVNPFVATLGMGFVITGVAEVASGGQPIIVNKASFATLGTGDWIGLPIPGVLLIVGLIIGGFTLARTVYGRYIYAIGGGEEASRLSGIRTRIIKTGAYALSGTLAALAGLVIAAQLSEGQADIGGTIELDVITIVVVGGTALAGGEGAMWRTAIGIGILAVMGNAFDRLQVNSFWQEIIKGVIIVGAIALDSYGKRRPRQYDVDLRSLLGSVVKRPPSKSAGQ